MTDLRTVYDATGANLPGIKLPPGAAMAAYVTGSGGVPWTAAQLAAHPGAVRIDQSPVNTAADETADLLDYENGAATKEDLAPWYRGAATNYARVARAGQRWPAVYCSYDNRTEVVNTFIAAGITQGPRLWLAGWDAPVREIIDALDNSGGPFPVIGWQAHNYGSYDGSLVRVDWLDGTASPYPRDQKGVVVSFTTEGRRDVVSADHGYTWR